MTKVKIVYFQVQWSDLDATNPLHHSLVAVHRLLQDAKAAISTPAIHPLLSQIESLRLEWFKDGIEIVGSAYARVLRTMHERAVRRAAVDLAKSMALLLEMGSPDVALKRYHGHPLLGDLTVIFYNDPDLRDMLEEIKVGAIMMKRKSVA